MCTVIEEYHTNETPIHIDIHIPTPSPPQRSYVRSMVLGCVSLLVHGLIYPGHVVVCFCFRRQGDTIYTLPSRVSLHSDPTRVPMLSC